MVPSEFSKWIKLIIGIKAVGLFCIWLVIDKPTIGDRAVEAQTVEPTTQMPAVAAVTKSTEENKTSTEQGSAKVRKSFLSNLLDLPALDKEKVSREEIGHYLELADRKGRQVDQRIKVLQMREEKIIAIEKKVDDKIKRLEEERRFFTISLQNEKKIQNDRLQRLIKLYEKMEPKRAAPVFEELDKDLVVQLFKQLPEKQVTKILEAMQPQKSVELSEYYGRIRSGKEYELLKEVNKSLLREFAECKGAPEMVGH